MQDIVNIETQFMKGMVSRLISRVLERKMDIHIDLQFDEFHVEHVDESIEMYVDISAEMNQRDLKEISKRYKCPKIILDIGRAVVAGALNIKPFNNKIQSEVKKAIKKKTGIDVKINDLKCNNKMSEVRVNINADAEMTEDQLQVMLEGYGLL